MHEKKHRERRCNERGNSFGNPQRMHGDQKREPSGNPWRISSTELVAYSANTRRNLWRNARETQRNERGMDGKKQGARGNPTGTPRKRTGLRIAFSTRETQGDVRVERTRKCRRERTRNALRVIVPSAPNI